MGFLVQICDFVVKNNVQYWFAVICNFTDTDMPPILLISADTHIANDYHNLRQPQLVRFCETC